MNLEKFEPRSGGMWRYTHKDKDGNEFGFHGVYHEVLAPERMIDTFEFEGLPEKGHVSLETAKFMELPGGRTRVNMQSVFQSVADRDGMMQSGMEQGINESFDRLDELLDDESELLLVEVEHFLIEARSLIRPSEEGDGFERSYYEALQREPDVIFAHVEVKRLLTKIAA